MHSHCRGCRCDSFPWFIYILLCQRILSVTPINMNDESQCPRLPFPMLSLVELQNSFFTLASFPLGKKASWPLTTSAPAPPFLFPFACLCGQDVWECGRLSGTMSRSTQSSHTCRMSVLNEEATWVGCDQRGSGQKTRLPKNKTKKKADRFNWVTQGMNGEIPSPCQLSQQAVGYIPQLPHPPGELLV